MGHRAGTMAFMWLTILSNFLQLIVLGLMGLVVNTHTQFTERHKNKILFSFLVISIVVFVIATCLALKQDRENAELWENITGGNAFPVVVPQGNSGAISLEIWNKGDHQLTGVTVSIRNANDFSALAGSRITLGTIPGSGHLSLPFLISPRVDSNSITVNGEKVDDYWIDISAQNGNYVEILQFKTGNNCLAWSTRYWVDREGNKFSLNNLGRKGTTQEKVVLN